MEQEADSAYKLLLSCPHGFSPSEVSVVFDESYDRVPHPDNNLENSISEIWDSRVQINKSLFNGQKFRYGGHIMQGEGGSSVESHVCLHLGLTDYRTFVGTNLNPLWEKFLVPSEDDVIQCQHTASPLGNGAVVETSDKKILLLQRSNNVGEFPGHFVFPGGHPEPQDAGITSHPCGSTDSEFINQKVSQEMFDSITREVVEEIGVPAESLCNPLFIGISRRRLNVRPAAFFFIKCSLQSNEIQQLYSTAQDGYESTQLFAVSMIELENMASKMPGCHQGGFALYKLMVEAMNNIPQNS
ncbi:Nudix hydrolase 9 [Citrus sinensis]|uniref:nudix hydrolase 9 n=1 Tax=Citrus sinensis TaxID=2711 RepID=UPI0003D7299B|nr:nudix hydrolase 9 [Citrus sinensis]KAH9661239.1 Nudix hydrolase 9 [Citrus sinensis]